MGVACRSRRGLGLGLGVGLGGYQGLPQQAWVLNESVRSNITFGSAFDAAKYAAVVACCALQEDLDQLHAGDATEVSP